MTEDDGLYQNYMDRTPRDRSKGVLDWWHKRLLLQYAKSAGKTEIQGLRVLEVGPGHGQFAEICTYLGLIYEFAEISRPVYHEMTRKGFTGALGDLDTVDLRQ
jgi:hypothetical protein